MARGGLLISLWLKGGGSVLVVNYAWDKSGVVNRTDVPSLFFFLDKNFYSLIIKGGDVS